MPKTAASQAFQVRGRRLRLLPFNTSVSSCSTVPLAAAAASAALPAAYAGKTLHTHAFCDCLMLDSLLLGELWLYLSLSSPGPAYPQGKAKDAYRVLRTEPHAASSGARKQLKFC